MSNLNSPTLDEVIENAVEEVLREIVEEESKETGIGVIQVEVVVEEGEAKAFYSNKGAETFQKYLVKKSFMKERGFKELASSFKEEIGRQGWE